MKLSTPHASVRPSPSAGCRPRCRHARRRRSRPAIRPHPPSFVRVPPASATGLAPSDSRAAIRRWRPRAWPTRSPGAPTRSAPRATLESWCATRAAVRQKSMEVLLPGRCRGTRACCSRCARAATQYSYAFTVQTDTTTCSSARTRAPPRSTNARSTSTSRPRLRHHARSPRHPGIADSLRVSPAHAAASLDARDLPVLYWCAAKLEISAIALGKDRPDMLAGPAGHPQLRELAPRWTSATNRARFTRRRSCSTRCRDGRLRSASARHHFDAVAISGDRRPSPYVTRWRRACP